MSTAATKKAVEVDLNQFAKWQTEGPRREVKIEIKENGTFSAEVIDWGKGYARQVVNSVDEIHLDEEALKMAEWSVKSAVKVVGVDGVRAMLEAQI